MIGRGIAAKIFKVRGGKALGEHNIARIWFGDWSVLQTVDSKFNPFITTDQSYKDEGLQRAKYRDRQEQAEASVLSWGFWGQPRGKDEGQKQAARGRPEELGGDHDWQRVHK